MANINRDKPTINKMSEEDTGIEKQIINMIKNVLVYEEYEDEKKMKKKSNSTLNYLTYLVLSINARRNALTT